MALSFHKSVKISHGYGIPNTSMGGCLRLQSVHIFFNLFAIQFVRI
jgi:hypothetical protein